MKPTVQKLRGIPITVVHRTIPHVWELKHNREHPTKTGSSDESALCFVASSVARPFVEWKKGISFPAPPPPPEYHDALKLREEFMGLKTEVQCLEFLRKVGSFSPLPEAERRYGWLLKELMGCQEMFRELAQRTPDAWNEYVQGLMTPQSNVTYGIVAAVVNSYRHTIEFQWNRSPQRDWLGTRKLAFIETTDAVSSILTTIELDHLRGAKFGACARHDCPKFFEITSRHKRKYCTQYCAHLEGLRRVRKRQKRAASKRGRSNRTKAGPK